MPDDTDHRDVIIIKVKKGHEHELIKEQNILDPASLMYPAFQAALNALEGIIISTIEWYSKYGKKDINCKHIDMALYGYANNIISFCGNRGQGKTSAMLSFTSTLGFRNHEHRIDGWNDGYETELQKRTRNCKFFVLPPIDPTMLRQQDNVIGLILTNLLKEIEDRWDNPKRSILTSKDGKPYEAKKYQILRAFQECISGLRLEGRENTERKTEFDSFAQSNDVFALKANILRIIHCLFELLGWNNDKSFLVVQLDDTDMHMDRAYEAVELIRKYLCIPSVVVVMATELSQLRSLVNLHYRQKLSYDPKSKVDFEFNYISAKYIDKLIPVPQMIHLPTLKSQRDLGKELELKVIDEDTNSEITYDNIQTALFDLIYEKTGLVFIKHASYMHEIIPSSLRGYMHLHRLLSSMKEPVRASLSEVDELDIQFCKQRLQRITQELQNLSQFEEYFLNEWIPSRVLEQENRKKVLALRDVSSGRLSQYITRYSLDHSQSVRCASGKKTSFTVDFCGGTAITINHYADTGHDESTDRDSGVYATYLNELSRYLKAECLTSEQYNFVFAIGTFVSIQLHKNSMIDEIETLQKWIKEGKIAGMIKFEHLTKMIEGDECTGLDRMRKAMKMEAEEEKKRGFDKGALAQGLLELLNTKSVIASLFQDGEGFPAEDPRFIRFQIALVYYCCNWDVLYQIYDNVNKYKDSNEAARVDDFVDEIADYLEKEKNAIGGRDGTRDRFKNLLKKALEDPSSDEEKKPEA